MATVCKQPRLSHRIIAIKQRFLWRYRRRARYWSRRPNLNLFHIGYGKLLILLGLAATLSSSYLLVSTGVSKLARYEMERTLFLAWNSVLHGGIFVVSLLNGKRVTYVYMGHGLTGFLEINWGEPRTRRSSANDQLRAKTRRLLPSSPGPAATTLNEPFTVFVVGTAAKTAAIRESKSFHHY